MNKNSEIITDDEVESCELELNELLEELPELGDSIELNTEFENE